MELNIIENIHNPVSIGDVKKLSMVIQNKSNPHTKIDNMWNEYISNSGIVYFQINCSGIVGDKKSCDLLLQYAFEHYIFKYEFISTVGTKIISCGKISSYERTFKSSDVEEFSMSILSSGKVEVI